MGKAHAQPAGVEHGQILGGGDALLAQRVQHLAHGGHGVGAGLLHAGDVRAGAGLLFVHVLQHLVQVGKVWLGDLGGLGAGVEDGVQRKAPVLRPLGKEALLVHGGGAAQAEAAQHLLRALIGGGQRAQVFLRGGQRRGAVFCPAGGLLFHGGEGDGGALAAGGDAVLDQHQHHLGLEVHVLDPAIDALVLLRLEQARAEQVLQRGVEAAVHLRDLVLGGAAADHQRLEVVVAVGGRVVARAAQHVLALPVGKGVGDGLFLHAQGAGDGGDGGVGHRVIAQAQAIDVDLDKVAGGAEHIFLDEQILHGRDVEHGEGIGK